MEEAVNRRNLESLIDQCTHETPTESKINSKTRYIYDILTTSDYARNPLRELCHQSKETTRTIIVARNGMLECGKNFKGTMKEMCSKCEVIDDENHRLNECKNVDRTPNRTNFDDIFSDNEKVLGSIINEIQNVWELRYANGRMKRT